MRPPESTAAEPLCAASSTWRPLLPVGTIRSFVPSMSGFSPRASRPSSPSSPCFAVSWSSPTPCSNPANRGGVPSPLDNQHGRSRIGARCARSSGTTANLRRREVLPLPSAEARLAPLDERGAAFQRIRAGSHFGLHLDLAAELLRVRRVLALL